MKQILLSFALFLHASKKYKKIKNFIHDILNNPNNPYKKYVDLSIIFLIVTSVVILIYEVKNPVPEWLDIYDIYFVSYFTVFPEKDRINKYLEDFNTLL